MSIFPVRLSEWFPVKPTKTKTYSTLKDQRFRYEVAKMIVDTATCCVCGKKPQYRYAWGMHAIPWGYGCDEIWCTKKCLDKGKEND